MNAAVLRLLGEPPCFEQFEEPVPGPEEAVVQVLATSLKSVDKQMASGSHYASFRELPAVCGVDGVGILEDGSRVFFAGPRRPFGAMAKRTVVARSRCWPIPPDVDDLTAAALPNPGVSAWMSLVWRAQLTPGQTVLVLGATGSPVSSPFRLPSYSALDVWWPPDETKRRSVLCPGSEPTRPSSSVDRLRN
jgi:NADPH:quinone reductase-like Zn-dependent oxidoreductase